MIRAILLVGGLGCLATLALAVAVYTYFGLNGAVAVGVAGLVAVPLAIKLLGGRLLGKALRVPFKLKGQPLRDARVRVHAVRRAAPPPPDPQDDDQDPDPREWYVIELTVSPGADPGKFRFWDPTELVLVAPDDDPDDPHDDKEWGQVARARVWRDGAWAPVDENLEASELRVRLLVGLRPGPPRSLRFRYYLEVFGHLDLARATQVPGV